MKLRFSFRLVPVLLILALILPVPFIVCAESVLPVDQSPVILFLEQYWEEIALVIAGLAAGLPVNFQRVISPLMALGRKIIKKK